MKSRSIMLIRHGEKPADDGGKPFGVKLDGENSEHDLLVRGWQRAGGLARLFAPYPSGTPIRSGLVQPTAIYAAAPASDLKDEAHEAKSRRSVETVSVLAEQLKLTTIVKFGPADTGPAAEDMRGQTGPVLAAWEHHAIADLVTAVTKGKVTPPAWNGTRFDMVLVLTEGEDGWTLRQVPQMLLPGDQTSDVSNPAPSAGGG